MMQDVDIFNSNGINTNYKEQKMGLILAHPEYNCMPVQRISLLNQPYGHLGSVWYIESVSFIMYISTSSVF